MSEEVVSSGGNSAPTSFAEAFAADASPASDPGQSSQESAPAAETPETAAPAPGDHASSEDRSPYIPRARFDEVNSKLAELKSWRESRAWAEQVDPQTFQTMREWYVRAAQDPQSFAMSLVDELSNDPRYAQAMRSEWARRLGTRGQGNAPAEPEMPQPDVEIVDAQGRVTGRTYSDQQLARRDEFLRAQVLKDVDAKYAPHVQTLEAVKREREQLAREADAAAFGKSFIAELATMPLFKENVQEIRAKLAETRLASDHPDAVRAAAYKIYMQVVGPKLQTQQQQSVVADFQRKAQASTGINPASSAPSSPTRPKSFADLDAKAWA